MSLTTDHGDIIFQCDMPGCPATLESNTSNFEAARNALRRARWKPFKAANDAPWQHCCYDCAVPR